MEYVKLGDIAKIVAGSTAPKENQFNDNIGLPFIRAGHLEDLCNNYDLKKLPKIDENNKNIKKQVKVPKNTIVFAKSGMSCMKSRVYQTTEECYIVNHLAGVICSENVNPSYLKYYFMVNKPNRLIVDESYPSIRLSDISNMDIYLPNLDTQQKIAEVLDKAQVLIDKRKEQIEALDELVKSRFIEMFGNPFDTTKWQIKKLKEVSISISDGSNIDKKYYQEHGEVLFLRIQNVWFNELRLEDSVYISGNVNQDYIDTSLHTGDLLITKIGRFYTKDSSLGRVSLYLGENDKANYSNNIMRVRLKNEVLSEYINALMNLDDYNQYIRNVSLGGTDKRALSKKLIGDFPIIVPPMELQNEFVDFVKQVEKLKSQMETSLKELEDNFNSLMQKTFKGELF